LQQGRQQGAEWHISSKRIQEHLQEGNNNEVMALLATMILTECAPGLQAVGAAACGVPSQSLAHCTANHASVQHHQHLMAVTT
jgi:hypothetical protein